MYLKQSEREPCLGGSSFSSTFMFIFSFKHYIIAFKGTNGESKPEDSLTVSDLPGEESVYLPQ